MGYTLQELQQVDNGETTFQELDLLKGKPEAPESPAPVSGRQPMFKELSPQEQEASMELGPTVPQEGVSFTEQLARRKQGEEATNYREKPELRTTIVQGAARKGESLTRFIDSSMYDGMSYPEAEKLYNTLKDAAGGEDVLDGQRIPVPDKDIIGGVLKGSSTPEATVGYDQLVASGIEQGVKELGRTAAAGVDVAADFLGFGSPGALNKFDENVQQSGIDTSESTFDTVVQETAQVVPGILASIGFKFNKANPISPIGKPTSFLGKGKNVAIKGLGLAKTEALIASTASPEMKIGFADGVTDYLFNSGDADPEVVGKLFTDGEGKNISQDLLKDKFSIMLEGMVLTGVLAGVGKPAAGLVKVANNEILFPIKAVFSKEAMKKDIAKSAIRDFSVVLNKGDPDASLKAADLLTDILEQQGGSKEFNVGVEDLATDTDYLRISITPDYLDTLYDGFKERIDGIRSDAMLDSNRELLPSEQLALDEYTIGLERVASLKKGLEQQSQGAVDLSGVAASERARLGTPKTAFEVTAEATGGMDQISGIAKSAFDRLQEASPRAEVSIKESIADVTSDLFEGWDQDKVISALTQSIIENKGGKVGALNQKTAREWATQIYDTYIEDRAKKNTEFNAFIDLIKEEELSPELQEVLQENGELLGLKKEILDKETGDFQYILPDNYGDAYKLVQKKAVGEKKYELSSVKRAVTQDEVARLARDDVAGPDGVSLKELHTQLMGNFKEYVNRWYNVSNAPDIGASKIAKIAKGGNATMEAPAPVLGEEAIDGELSKVLPEATAIGVTEAARGDILGSMKGGATDAIQWQIQNIKNVRSPEEAKIATQRVVDLTLGETLKSIEPELMKLGREKGVPENAKKILSTLDAKLAELETNLGGLFDGEVTTKINDFRKALIEKGGNLEELVQNLDALKTDAYLSQTAIHSENLQKVLRQTPYGAEISAGNPEQLFGRILTDPKGADQTLGLLEAINASGASETEQVLAKRGLQETYLRTVMKNMLEPGGNLSVAKAQKYLQGDNGVGAVLFDDPASAERLAALNTILEVSIGPKVFRESGDVVAHAPKNPRAIGIKGLGAMGSVITLGVGILSRLGASLRIGAKAVSNAANSTEIATQLMDQFYTDAEFAKKLIQAEKDYMNHKPNEFMSQLIYRSLSRNIQAAGSGKNQSEPLTIEEVDKLTLEEWDNLQKEQPKEDKPIKKEMKDLGGWELSPKRESTPFN